MTLIKQAIDYTGDERAEIYSNILKEEISNIKLHPNHTRITGGQIIAAKGRATRKFFKMGF